MEQRFPKAILCLMLCFYLDPAHAGEEGDSRDSLEEILPVASSKNLAEDSLASPPLKNQERKLKVFQSMKLRQGSRVRLGVSSIQRTRIVGSIVDREGLKLFIQEDFFDSNVEVPYTAIETFEFSNGTKNHTTAGAIIGVGPGLALAVAMGFAFGCSEKERQSAECWEFFTRKEAGGVAALITVPVFVAIGGLIGSTFIEENWEGVLGWPTAGMGSGNDDEPRLKITLKPSLAGTLHLRSSVSF